VPLRAACGNTTTRRRRQLLLFFFIGTCCALCVPRSKIVVQQQLFEKINAISFMISSNWGKKRTKTIFNIISILYALCMIQINKRIKSNVGAAK
jgi:hypothetical protein